MTRTLGRKFVSLVLCLAMAIAMVNLPLFTKTTKAAGGSGTESDPILIASYDQLRDQLATSTTQKTYLKLTQDLTSSDERNNYNLSVNKGADYVIDLSGYDIKRYALTTDDALFYVRDGSLQIINTDDNTGIIYAYSPSGSAMRAFYAETGTLILGRENYSDKIDIENAYDSYVVDGNLVTIKTSALTKVYNGIHVQGNYCTFYGAKNSEVYIYGGIFEKGVSVDECKFAYVESATINAPSRSSVNTFDGYEGCLAPGVQFTDENGNIIEAKILSSTNSYGKRFLNSNTSGKVIIKNPYIVNTAKGIVEPLGGTAAPVEITSSNSSQYKFTVNSWSDEDGKSVSFLNKEQNYKLRVTIETIGEYTLSEKCNVYMNAVLGTKVSDNVYEFDIYVSKGEELLPIDEVTLTVQPPVNGKIPNDLTASVSAGLLEGIVWFNGLDAVSNCAMGISEKFNTENNYSALYGITAPDGLSFDPNVNVIVSEGEVNRIKFYDDNTMIIVAVNFYGSIVTGKAGDNATWTLNKETGEMVISGSGPLYDSNNPEMFTNKVENYQNIIKTVTYEEGITTSGNSLFGFCQNITSVKLPNSMTTIEAGAFAGTQFANITIPKSVTKIDEYAFMGSSPLTVDYRGSKEDWNKINISQKENKRLLNATVNYHNYTPVSSVSVTGYVEPVAGKTPTKPNKPDGVNYNVTRSWYEVPAVGNTKDAKLVTGNFEAGKIYCLTLDFTVSGEYEFTPDVKAYVDGKEVEIVKISDNKIRVLIYTELKPKNGIEGFCERLYTCALNRESDPTGMKTWVGVLTDGSWNGADVARGFFFSDELINSNISDDEFITRLYATFMDRKPDGDGFKTWQDAFAKGWTREQVFMGFVDSQEWANVCFKYGIASGGAAVPNITLEPTLKIIAFATRLYTTCLCREGEEEGIKNWAEFLANRKMTGTQAAYNFFFSEEFLAQNVDNGEYVTRLYATFMGREPDKGGYDMWVGLLKSGEWDREKVFYGFAQSEEFKILCRESGITS